MEKIILYKDKSKHISERVEDLVNQMTLEEKVAQILCLYAKKGNFQDDNGNYDRNKAEKLFQTEIGRIAEVGFVANSAKEMAELTNEIQKYYIENTRLGIPVLFHEECLHGQMVKDATSFPQPIALASTWNTQLIEKVYSVIAEETRSRGGHQALTPVADVAREPRWGRVEETFGEDPYLVSEMVVASVKGFQGEGELNNKKHLIATLKHFVAHAQPEGGSNCAPVNVSERVLREVFFPPFKDGIQKSNALSVMASYNEVNAIPSHKNRWLLVDILRNEWGFKGLVVSDYYAVKQLEERHHVVGNDKEAAFQAFTSGIDIELPKVECYQNTIDLVKEKRISEEYYNEVVKRILELKFKLGLFEDPYVDPHYANSFCGSEIHRPLALQAARESITLLKNENNILPLDQNKIKTIAVIGPNAHKVLLGGYSGKPKFYTSVLDGIKNKVGDEVQVLYAEGCRITEPGDWEKTDKVTLSNYDEDSHKIKEAVSIAKQSDVIVLAIGGNELTSREAWNEDHLGDRPTLELVGMQNELVKELLSTNKPIVTLLFNGRPLSVNYVYENVDALLECWYLGQETGGAVADVLFGDFNPCGKLPISFPRSVGHIPAYYNHKLNDRRGYLFDDVSPLFSFGYGESFTTFIYENVKLLKSEIYLYDETSISVEVTNTGERSGYEVVQIYIRDCFSSVTRPVKELKGFKKIFFNAGESKIVKYKISFDQLAFWNEDMEYIVEEGEFEIMVGSSSRHQDLCSTKLIVKLKE